MKSGIGPVFRDCYGRGRLTPAAFVVFSVFITVISAYLAVPLNEIMAITALILSAVAFVLCVRHMPLLSVLGGVCLLSALYCGSIIPAAVLLGVVLVIGAEAFFIAKTRLYRILILIPIVYLLSLAISRDFLFSFLPLACFPAAAVIAIAVAKKREQVSVICYTSAAVCVCIVFAFLLYMIITQGFSADAFTAAAEQIKQAFAEYLATLHGRSGANIIYYFNEETAATTAELMMSVSPALVVVTGNIIAYFALSVFISLFKLSKAEKLLPVQVRTFSISPVTATVFMLAYFAITLFTGKSDRLFLTVVAENIYFILLPGLATVGIFALTDKKHRRRSNIVFIVLILIVAFVVPLTAALLAAFYGVFVIYYTSAFLSAKRRAKKDNSDE